MRRGCEGVSGQYEGVADSNELLVFDTFLVPREISSVLRLLNERHLEVVRGVKEGQYEGWEKV